MTDNQQDHRPWFGAKRVGWGLRPQTWQGWLIVALFVIVVLLIVRFVA